MPRGGGQGGADGSRRELDPRATSNVSKEDAELSSTFEEYGKVSDDEAVSEGYAIQEAEAKAIGGKLSLGEQSAFMGTVRAHTSVMVMPELLDHVRESVEKDAKLAKAMRMAREEKDARAKR